MVGATGDIEHLHARRWRRYRRVEDDVHRAPVMNAPLCPSSRWSRARCGAPKSTPTIAVKAGGVRQREEGGEGCPRCGSAFPRPLEHAAILGLEEIDRQQERYRERGPRCERGCLASAQSCFSED